MILLMKLILALPYHHAKAKIRIRILVSLLLLNPIESKFQIQKCLIRLTDFEKSLTSKKSIKFSLVTFDKSYSQYSQTTQHKFEIFVLKGLRLSSSRELK